MASLMQDLARVVLFSNDVLDTDIQRVRMLQKVNKGCCSTRSVPNEPLPSTMSRNMAR